MFTPVPVFTDFEVGVVVWIASSPRPHCNRVYGPMTSSCCAGDQGTSQRRSTSRYQANCILSICALILLVLNRVWWVQVSLASDPKVVAGKIAHCSRSNRPPTVLAIGQGCLNQAIKVTCTARCSLGDANNHFLLCPTLCLCFAVSRHCQEVLHAAPDIQRCGF